MHKELTKVVVGVVKEGTKAITLTAGLAIISMVAKDGLDSLATLSLDKLIKK